MDSGSEPTRKLQLAPPEDAASSRRELEERVSKLKAGESADSTVLLLSEQPEDQRTLEKVLEDWRLRIVRCSSFREALQVLSLCPVLLAFCDVRNANSTFDELLPLIRLERPTRIVAMVPEDIGESAYRAVMQMGAFNVVSSPCRRSDVQWTILYALRDRAARAELRSSQQRDD